MTFYVFPSRAVSETFRAPIAPHEEIRPVPILDIAGINTGRYRLHETINLAGPDYAREMEKPKWQGVAREVFSDLQGIGISQLNPQ